jgi:membrane-associated phospholipid phosphatase
VNGLIHIGLAAIILTGNARASIVEDDLKALFTMGNLQIAAIGLGVAGGVHTWDHDLEGELQGSVLFDHPSAITNIYGSSHFNLPVALGVWGVGRLADRPALEHTGSAALRTLALTQLVVGPIKWAVRRDRPDQSSQLSFPSGHAANSFALARLMHRQYGLRVGVPLYIVGALTGAGRIEGDKHYLSDVVMGAVLGTLVGQAVTLERGGRLRALPQLSANGPQLVLYVKF